MRRAMLLLALLALVIWLSRGAPPNTQREQSGRDWFIARTVEAQSSCCANPGEEDPHQECVNGSCEWVQGCGVSDCSACYCDPNQEWTCINEGGQWDPYSCSCYYSCDPDGSLEANCYYSGGTWDPASCTCEAPACNPSGPYETEQISTSYSYCDGYYIWDCEGTWTTYDEYCQDGSVYNEWTEYTEVCTSDGSYCGQDPCYDDPYCYCYWDYCS
jgi:hypothetical protein